MKKYLLTLCQVLAFTMVNADTTTNKITTSNSSSCDDKDCIITITLETPENKNIHNAQLKTESINLISSKCKNSQCAIMVKVPKNDRDFNIDMTVGNESSSIVHHYKVPEYYQ